MSKSKTIFPSETKCLHTNIFGTVPGPFWLIPRAGDLLGDDPMISLPWNPCCKAELEWKFTSKGCSCLAPAFLAFQRLTLDSLTDANSIAVKSRSLKSITRSASLKSAVATHETSNAALYEVGRDLLWPSLTATVHCTALGGKVFGCSAVAPRMETVWTNPKYENKLLPSMDLEVFKVTLLQPSPWHLESCGMGIVNIHM